MSDAPVVKPNTVNTRPQVGDLPIVISVQVPGVTVASSGTTARTPLSLNANGDLPNRVRVAATASAYVRLGTSAVVAVAGDTMVQPGDALILDSMGATHIATLQVTGPGVVQASSIEN